VIVTAERELLAIPGLAPGIVFARPTLRIVCGIRVL
jgi:hypothetical protein